MKNLSLFPRLASRASLHLVGDFRCTIINTTLLMKKKIIQDILMVIIVAFMCLIFGRSSVSGSNNLAWLFIVVLANIGVIWYDFSNYAATWAKQLVITLPFIITLLAQYSKIGGVIPETYQVLWHNYAIAYAICFFNIIICCVNQEEEDRDESYNAKTVGEGLAFLSGIAIIVMTCILLSHI